MQSISVTFFSAFSLSFTDSNGMKARIHQKSCNILQHLHSTKTERGAMQKKGNARKKKKTFYLFMFCFYIYLYLLKRNFKIHYYLLQAMMTIVLLHLCSLFYLWFSLKQFIDLKIICDIGNNCDNIFFKNFTSISHEYHQQLNKSRHLIFFK